MGATALIIAVAAGMAAHTAAPGPAPPSLTLMTLLPPPPPPPPPSMSVHHRRARARFEARRAAAQSARLPLRPRRQLGPLAPHAACPGVAVRMNMLGHALTPASPPWRQLAGCPRVAARAAARSCRLISGLSTHPSANIRTPGGAAPPAGRCGRAGGRAGSAGMQGRQGRRQQSVAACRRVLVRLTPDDGWLSFGNRSASNCR